MLKNDIKHVIDKKDELLPYCPKKNPTMRNSGRINLSKGSLAILAFVLVLLLGLTPFLLLLGGENPPMAPTTVGGTSTEFGSGFIAEEDVTDLVQTADGGFALAITTRFELTGDSDILLVKTGMDGNVEWSKTYGLSRFDEVGALIQTIDGGYALFGKSYHTFDVGYDFPFLWFIKTDASGNVLWNKTLEYEFPDSSSHPPFVYNVIQTKDGGFAFAGSARSTVDTEYRENMWLIKTDSNGVMEWSNTYRGTKKHQTVHDLVQTKDNGFILVGTTMSSSGGTADMQLVKTDSNGVMEWCKTYGGANDEHAYTSVQTGDGGFALAGAYEGYRTDMFLVKTDSDGIIEWCKTYGGEKHDAAYSLIQTGDGGFVLAGYGDYDYSRSDSDTYLVKIDGNGDLEWNRIYGGPEYDGAEVIIQATDGSFVIAGFTDTEYGGTITGKGTDAWLMKTDESGNELWKYFFGSIEDEEWANDLVQTVDGGFVFTGPVGSGNTGRMDAWLVKTDGNGLIEWDRTFGGPEDDIPEAVIQTSDGGFVIAGSTSSRGAGKMDAWLVKTDRNGLVTWNKTYGGEEDDGAETVMQTADGGFALAGYTRSYGAGGSDAWLIKTDGNGTVEWNCTFGGDLDDKITDLYQLANGSFVLLGYHGQELITANCGWNCLGGHSDFYDNAWLLVVDETGNLQQDFVYEIPGCVRFHDVRSTGDGIVIAGLSASQGDWSTGWMTDIGNNSLFYLRIDKNGVYHWNKTLDNLFFTAVYTSSFQLGDLIFTADGGFILIGQCIDEFDERYQSLVKMDSNGQVQWDLYFKVEHLTIAPVLIQTSDGGYALVWGVLSHGTGGESADAWLARIDENGNLLWEEAYGITGGEIVSWQFSEITEASQNQKRMLAILS
ncbi:MAG: hypothetical protein ACFFD4_33585 [Candidatus Odinarchaeota archaeon]